jgi:hypothetical protein
MFCRGVRSNGAPLCGEHPNLNAAKATGIHVIFHKQKITNLKIFLGIGNIVIYIQKVFHILSGKKMTYSFTENTIMMMSMGMLMDMPKTPRYIFGRMR